MKSFLIIGMGRFGHHITENLSKQKCEIMIVDSDEEKLADLLPFVVSAKIGDCTKPEVLKSLGIQNFDCCIVCIGTNFQSSLEVTSLLKEMGAKYVISKASRDIQAKFLLKNGADEVIYPDRDIAKNLAVRYTSNNVFDYIELCPEYGIYEIAVREDWVGHSIKELAFRTRYKANILGVKNGSDTNLAPGADYVFSQGEHLLVIGKKNDINNISK